jgi:pimeloyl-ACP methyl ester carboxylesterase
MLPATRGSTSLERAGWLLRESWSSQRRRLQRDRTATIMAKNSPPGAPRLPTETKRIQTSQLDIAYEESGAGRPVVLLHGFPYDPRSYDEVVPPLVEAGCRVIVPYLRGYGPTRFLSDATLRSGQQAALANDLKEVIEGLGLAHAVLAGYDWGGRAACIVSALWPELVRGLVTINDAYHIHDVAGSAKPLPPEDEHRLWYQYYFHTERAAPGSPRTATRSASCCGVSGRRPGASTTRPTTAPRLRSTTRTSSPS